MKTLSVNIYRSNYDSILNFFKDETSVMLLHENGPFELESKNIKIIDHPAGQSFGKIAVPVDQNGQEILLGHRMFGGTFVYSSDSRFPEKYPVPLHDRFES